VNRARALALLAGTLAALGLLARAGSLPAGLVGPLAPFGAVPTPTVAAALTLGTVTAAAVAARHSDGESDPAGTFRNEPSPETQPLLGADVAAALDRIADRGPGASPDDRETVRAGIERAGTAVVARVDGLDRDAARARFRRGDWTPDPAVAAFCGADVTVDRRTRVREALGPEPRFVRRARRTVEALAAYAKSGGVAVDAVGPRDPSGRGGDRG